MNHEKIKPDPILRLLERIQITVIIIGAIFIGTAVLGKTGFISDEQFFSKIVMLQVGIFIGIVITMLLTLTLKD